LATTALFTVSMIDNGPSTLSESVIGETSIAK
jgi:hypothetical protein